MEEQTMNITDVFKILKRRFKLLISITILITALSVFISYFLITPKYEASTKLFIGKTETSGETYNQNDILMYQKLMKTYSEIIKTKDLMEDALKNVGTSDNPEEALLKLTVTPSSDTQILKISFKDSNPIYAADMVNAITNEFINKSNSLVKNANITIIEKVTVPNKAISPQKGSNVIVGVLLGIILGILVIFLQEFLDNTFKNKREVEQYLNIPVLGVIPMFENKTVNINNRNKNRTNDKKRR